MVFKDFEYKRVDIEELKSIYNRIKEDLEKSESSEKAAELYLELDELNKKFGTNYSLAYIRNSIDTTDEFYAAEKAFYDENLPLVSEFSNELGIAFANSKFRPELEERFGKLAFQKIDLDLKIFKNEIVEDLQEENKLTTEYVKLTSSAKIMFDGEERNLSEMVPYTQNIDREVRKEAVIAVGKFFEENMEEYDRIYDSMVKVRDRIAKKLGYENFVEVGYLRMGRLDYNAKDVANYRKQIKESVVPLYVELRKKQEKRIKVDKLKYYDEGMSFLTGNPTPKGDREWMVDKAKTMYKELSPETHEFFSKMVEQELLDLDSKKGKQGGGYCTSLDSYNMPFIFANFNGTAHDVEVLTHEAGHAFQSYQTMRNVDISAYYWPTSESAEIHSMSMEFLTWPWMESFFKEDIDKFKYHHLSGAFLFIPYGALVDEFQHYVYENPNVTPEDRRMKWLELEKEYLPTRDYDGIESYEKGLFWFKQGHIFEMPFYYIDYTLAQVIALQMWKLNGENKELAWEKYMRLCNLGGSKTFLGLLEDVKLDNPFESGSISKIIPPVKAFLETINDENL
ncbi:M3 family oligoendopeptidase [Streptobacillus felis]|uniref:M3 family oligoendopeptidase n=1 Tax=Streptobacillus felis TaxID=1384509 RepID=A0A7Z0T767_9FUSO|nr:M3 family oligoendopeptidase [Streptobacillus felis]NYV27966.1 M3 family oligoendopeptidase [Streptobacillus felis]